MLKNQAIPYNSEIPRHEIILKELWEKVYPDSILSKNLLDKKWKELGFQVFWENMGIL